MSKDKKTEVRREQAAIRKEIDKRMPRNGAELIGNKQYSLKDGAQKNTAEGGGVQYSLKSFEDGRRFVDVDVDQAQFDGLSIAEMNSLAKQIIKSKYSGKVVGIDNTVFVNGKSSEKYVYFPPGTDKSIVEAKARASTELDNLIDAGTNFRTKPDGADGHVHPDAVGGFSYFDTLFKVGTQYYKGVINIKNIGKGRLFWGVTKTENITQDIHDSYGENPTVIFLRDVSTEIVPQPDDSVKQHSLKGTANMTAEVEKLREVNTALREKLKLTEFAKVDVKSLPREDGGLKHNHSIQTTIGPSHKNCRNYQKSI